MAKLEDIAAVAGVSVSTVSKALRGFKEISVETRRRITRAAKDLGYDLSRAAAAGGTDNNIGTIGVICPELRSSHYAEVVSSLESVLKRRGYSMLLGLSDFAYEEAQLLLKRFVQQDIQGIICITNTGKIDNDLRQVHEKHGLPIVLLATTYIATEEFDHIKVNDDFGVRIAVNHLVEIGHRSIGFVGEVLSERRLDTFIDTLKQHGIPVHEEILCIGKERFEQGGYLRMKELLKQDLRPTAVVASYDDIAIGALRAIGEAGLSVPEDISIIGFDGIKVGAFLPIPLTTIASHVEEMTEATVNILLRKVESKNITVVQHLEFNPELIIRSSTAPPK